MWYATGRALVTTRLGFPEWAAGPWIAEPLSYLGYKVLLPGTVLALALVDLPARLEERRPAWRDSHRASSLALSLDSARNTSLFAIVAGALLPGFLHEPHVVLDHGSARCGA